MKYKNGDAAQLGDVIRWNCWDGDDFTNWTFTGLVLTTGVVYLGGGIDFGMGIGQIFSYERVISEAENNDAFDAGIEKIGKAADLCRYISDFKSWQQG